MFSPGQYKKKDYSEQRFYMVGNLVNIAEIQEDSDTKIILLSALPSNKFNLQKSFPKDGKIKLFDRLDYVERYALSFLSFSPDSQFLTQPAIFEVIFTGVIPEERNTAILKNENILRGKYLNEYLGLLECIGTVKANFFETSISNVMPIRGFIHTYHNVKKPFRWDKSTYSDFTLNYSQFGLTRHYVSDCDFTEKEIKNDRCHCKIM